MTEGTSEATQARLDRFAVWLRGWSKREGMSQREIARRSGLTVTTLNAYFTARNLPKVDALNKMSEGMGVPVGDLLYYAGYDVEPPVGSDARQRLVWLAETMPEHLLVHAIPVLEGLSRSGRSDGEA